MESHRKGNTFIQLSINNKGIALVTAIFISVLALVVLGGLYFALTRYLSAHHTVKNYASARDAAIGGIEYGVSVVNTYDPCNMEDALTEGKVVCFDAQQKQWLLSSETSALKPVKLKFKIYGTDKVYENVVTVCVTGYKVREGVQISGVAYSKKEADCKSSLYTMIISEAEGPNDTKSRIEATYLP